jgi:Proteasome subunit A N-terminal signature
MTRQIGAHAALLVLLILSGITRKASSSNSYNPYMYDLTAPLFTPDGRLLQTEYATRAADHSSPLVSARIHDHLAVMACCHGRRRGGAASTTSTFGNGPPPLPLPPPVQERLILLPSPSASISCLSVATHHDQNDNPSSLPSRPTPPTIVLALAGVRADCLHLLQVVQDRVWEIHRKYGSVSNAWDTQDEAATTTTLLNARAIATVIASECQRFTFGGGIRTLGGTVWVTASDNWLLHGASSIESDHFAAAAAADEALFVLHQTDPSGAVHDVVLGRNTAVLGGGDAGLRLQRRLDQEWSGTWNNDDKNLVDDTGAHEHERRCLGHLLSILVEERERDMHSSDAHKVDTKNDAKSWSSLLEVVLLSPSKGAIKLTSNQVRSLLLAHSTSLQRE